MRYRTDRTEPQPDGSAVRYTLWMGGPTIAGVSKCRIDGLPDDRRYAVRTTGHADTYFSLPAEATIKGRTVRGYLGSDGDGVLTFRPYTPKGYDIVPTYPGHALMHDGAEVSRHDTYEDARRAVFVLVGL